MKSKAATKKDHNADIISQFSKQAIPFTQYKKHLDSVERLVSMSKLKPEDRVLDVACGSGIVLCEFAKKAKSAIGIDITTSMIEQAKKRQAEMKLANITWDIGDVESLPYKSNSFSVVVTRYSFHHFLNPKEVLEEMYRVCKPSGRIVIADVIMTEKNLPFYNEVEKLRDSSHVSGLTFEQMENLFYQIGLKDIERSGYSIEMELEKQLKTSFPKEGDVEKIRKIFKNDLSKNKLGLDACLKNGTLHFSFPISVYVGVK